MIKHENVEKKFACDICGMKFKLQCYVKKHITQCHNPDDYIGNCEECGRGYKLAYQIRECCHEIKIAKYKETLKTRGQHKLMPTTTPATEKQQSAIMPSPSQH